MGLLQLIGLVLLLLVISAPIIPAWYVGKLIVGADPLNSSFDVGARTFRNIWLPIAVPTWMFCFTLSVIAAKWIVIGKYREGQISVPSLAYVRWWWVDRALHLWEFWIGRYLLDTPLIWIVYTLMGANLHSSAKLDAFVREFDLVKIEDGAVIEHEVRCRKFGSASGDGRSTLRFRSIAVGKRSTVLGMLSPGVSVGESAMIQRRSVLPEGVQVPDGVIAVGNPAFKSGLAPPDSSNTPGALIGLSLGTLKIVWLAVELYIFFGLLLVAQLIFQGRLPNTWAYTPLCYWSLLIATQIILSMFLSIILKWILVGRRKPSPRVDSLWRTFADWVADYHYGIAAPMLESICPNSRIWNFILMLYGMDIDFRSKIEPTCFAPSKVDLISIKDSFVSVVGFYPKGSSDGACQRIEISNSSIGFGVAIGPGVRTSQAIIPPLEYIHESVIQRSLDAKYQRKSSLGSILVHEGQIATFSVIQFLAILASLVPSYELWQFVLQPASVETATPVLAMALALQTLAWVSLLFLVQTATLWGWQKRTSPWCASLYLVYIDLSASIQNWSCLPLLWGTPFFTLFLQTLGAAVDGRLLHFGRNVHDIALLHVTGDTISDGAQMTGHQAVFDEITIGKYSVSDILQPGTFVASNAVVNGSEPWRAHVGASSDQLPASVIESNDSSDEEDAVNHVLDTGF